ncbi:glycoside hydrolase superfamily [Hyaloraphidium curvatum]|nr:glycoside hydrolase superfamily [Hyaloraphidium curvatum]
MEPQHGFFPIPNPAAASFSFDSRSAPRQFSTIALRPLVTAQLAGAASEYIAEAIARLSRRLLAAYPIPGSSFTTGVVAIGLSVIVVETSRSAWEDASEDYSLNVPAEGDIAITAQSAVGVLRALATFAQMVTVDDPSNPKLWAVRPFSVQRDRPAFSYRGVMIDTARHFMPVPVLKRMIDGMEVVKLNRLHLHLYDSQSFPLQWPGLDGAGELWKRGCFKDEAGNHQVYSEVELSELVDYAEKRGVVVVPEFEMPGHTDIFHLAHPEIMCGNPSRSMPAGQMQALAGETYQVIGNLIDWGLRGPFQRCPAFHCGQDEVHKWVWNHSRNLEDYDFLKTMGQFQGFITAEVVKRMGRTLIAWEDLVCPVELTGSGVNEANGFADDGSVIPTKSSGKMLLQAWKSLNSYRWLMDHGYRTLFSVADFWYFSAGQWVNPGTGSISFTTAYNAPIPATKGAPANFAGGEGCIWTEETHSGVIDKVLWPRAGAVAERLWSNPDPQLSGTLCTMERVDRLNGFLRAVGIDPWPAQTVMR